MYRTEKLTTYYTNFSIDYVISRERIYVVKAGFNGKKKVTVLFPKLEKACLRKLCAYLWLAGATPYTAKELADELIEDIIK